MSTGPSAATRRRTPPPKAAAKPSKKAKPKPKGKANEPAVDPRQPYRAAMRDLIARRWGEVWRAVPVALAGDDIEGVHDVRVASRRLRAAMDVAGDCFPAGWYRPLRRAAKEITGALGGVRDRDVLIEAWSEERTTASAAERPGIDRLLARVEAERVVARAEMERFLADLIERGVPKEAARRFGPAAAAPAPLLAAAAPGSTGGDGAEGER